MTTEEYLSEILENQTLAPDGDEMKDLRQHREDVEQLLRSEFADCSPTIRYGGSKAKGTMIREAYDLDAICYFPRDDNDAGGSLEDIYNNVKTALEKQYFVDPKTSALRLKSKDGSGMPLDFHIDVVPGRYVNGDDGDCFMYQHGAEKQRLKTNLDVHINHVKDSGVVPAIRLQKLWKVRKGLTVKQFVWELLIIKLLEGKEGESLADQLLHVWTELRDSKDPISVEDPANPDGNNLSALLDSGVWSVLTGAAYSTLRTIETVGWESVFGPAKRLDGEERLIALTQAASIASVRSKPWGSAW